MGKRFNDNLRECPTMNLSLANAEEDRDIFECLPTVRSKTHDGLHR